VLTVWRWRDYRELAAQPAPEPLDPATASRLARQRLVGVVERLPVGGALVAEARRQRTLYELRGTEVRSAWLRLDRAAAVLSGLAGRLGGVAAATVPEAAVAERSLRDLAVRAAAVERSLRLADGETRDALAGAHQAMVAELTAGVAAYEQLVAAAAGYVAEDGRVVLDGRSVGRLTEATDLLRGFAHGLSEARTIAAGPRL
jgi:hypothetical protein